MPGQNYDDMKSAVDISKNHLMLLSTIDLDEVVDVVSSILMQIAQPKAIAILIWDQDMENFNDTFLFGPRKKDFGKFIETFAEEVVDKLDEMTKNLEEVDLDSISARLSSELAPVYCYHVQKEEQRAALLLVAGDDEIEAAELEEGLAPYPLFQAMHNAWEVRELRRENERLRNNYEELEQQTSVLEEQTRKLIHETMAKDSLRTQHVDRERLIYQISNVVRSSLEITQVLQTSVSKIGATFDLSRCLLMRPTGEESIAVFEWDNQGITPVKHLFEAEEGRSFTSTAFTKTAPHDFADPNTDTQQQFDKHFLQEMGLLSGLLVPLVLRNRNIGTIFLQDCVTPRDWSIDNTALFGSLADQLSVAIENADLHEEKKMQAVTDGLTGIANRRHFNDTFSKEFERAKRYGETLSLIVVDLDFLKKINDTYGHQVGDEAIKTIGWLLSSSCRSIDLPARYGGEEFCLLLPNTDLQMAEVIAERLRKLINETPIEGPGTISASIGVANFPMHASEPDELFEAADEALYCAKDGGRNKVCVSAHLAE